MRGESLARNEQAAAALPRRLFAFAPFVGPSAVLGQPVVVENLAGASGAIGAARVGHTSPDGYTLLFASASQIIIAPLVQKTSYDPQKDFVPVSIYRGSGAAAMAMRSISTSNGPCQAETQMKLRAGGSDGKYRA